MRNRAVTVGRTILALVGWATLSLQLYLTVSANLAIGNALPTGVLRNISFFTVLTNTIVAIVLSASLLPETPRRWLSTASTRAAVAAYIAMVGIIYSLLLRHVWDPQGAQKLADIVLHDAMPVAYVLYWLTFWRTGTLPWSIVPLWLVYPIGYLGYCLVHGAITGWYPYLFIDVSQLGHAEVVVNAFVLTVAFTILCLIVVAMDRVQGRPVRTFAP
jgi:hypothetical protein